MAKVLVVDDSLDTVRLVGMILQADRHEVVGVDSPARAFAALRLHTFDVVIADQNMPGMTGDALLERVGVLWPKMGRLMLTADPRIRATGKLPYPVMYKPFKVADLRARLDALLHPPAH